MKYKMVSKSPLTGAVAAISVGMLKGEAILDLCYEEDSRADVDANVVMTDDGRFVEFQATAEHKSFDDEQMGQYDGSGAGRESRSWLRSSRPQSNWREDLLRDGQSGKAARVPAGGRVTRYRHRTAGGSASRSQRRKKMARPSKRTRG